MACREILQLVSAVGRGLSTQSIINNSLELESKIYTALNIESATNRVLPLSCLIELEEV